MIQLDYLDSDLNTFKRAGNAIETFANLIKHQSESIRV